MTLQQKALEIAITQLGVEEKPHGSNAGPEVEMYLKSIGLGKGYSWCMALMYWCMQQAADALGRQNPMFKTGGVLMQWQKRKTLFGKYSSPQPGDIFIMDYGKGQGHTGIVERVEDGVVHTIEGNTNDEGSREGYEVCRRTRQRSKILGYLRFE
jgi:hypothetical protein